VGLLSGLATIIGCEAAGVERLFSNDGEPELRRDSILPG